MRSGPAHHVQGSQPPCWAGRPSPRPFHRPGLITQALAATNNLCLGCGLGSACVCASVCKVCSVQSSHQRALNPRVSKQEPSRESYFLCFLQVFQRHSIFTVL